ncbi:MAG: hypothetical protein R3228_17065, partial [Halioglobus sp.]|nr:hypothetical protein [Halioglobus sp.]
MSKLLCVMLVLLGLYGCQQRSPVQGTDAPPAKGASVYTSSATPAVPATVPDAPAKPPPPLDLTLPDDPALRAGSSGVVDDEAALLPDLFDAGERQRRAKISGGVILSEE